MMPPERLELIEYRKSRVKEKLEAAEDLIKKYKNI